ncbi:MAG: class I SAM-dependent methyltransferase [Rhodobacteraceae bacterium]|nr:class I SAM-dependent methyltransferase [Paracoccaceae bacterium]
MTEVSPLSHFDRLSRLVPLSGCDVLDIGAGDGATAARMADAGARVTGLEVDAARVALATAQHGSKITMREGRAEALPFPDAAFDLATLFFSLHHVPVPVHGAALAEVSRVVRPGGQVFIVEPLPEGPMFELVRPLDDETVVREAAQARLAAMAGGDPRFALIVREAYTTERRIPELQGFIDRLVGVDPARAARLPAVQDALAARYAAAPRDATGTAVLTQPCVACLFGRV